jgi:tetratricopeptide (TPR) repeat protein
VRALLKRYPDSGPLYALNAWLLLRQKRPDDGLMMLEQARLCDMAHTGLYRYGRGLMAAEQGDRQSAARELAQACDLLPDKLFVQLETARFYGGKTQLDKAIEYYRRATRTSDCSADTWAEMAVALEVAGDADGALAALYRAFQLRNDSLSITRQLAAMLKRKGRHEDALGVLKRAAEANPCKPGLLAAYGDGAAEMWRIGEAQKAFRQSLQADSQFTYGQVRLAAMLRLQRQYAQAESLLKQVLAQQPDYVPALLELARTWQDLGRTEEALSALQQSIERDPAARLFAARLWFEAGDGAEAIRQAQIAVSSRPDAETYVTLSGIFLSSGDTGKAEAAALGAAEKDSFSSAAHLALARAMAAGGKDEPARTETARALELDPYSVEALRFAGNLRAASGDFAGCAELWQRAIDLNPWHAELHWQLARLLSQQLDDSLRAQEHERRYAELEQMRRSAAP